MKWNFLQGDFFRKPVASAPGRGLCVEREETTLTAGGNRQQALHWARGSTDGEAHRPTTDAVSEGRAHMHTQTHAHRPARLKKEQRSAFTGIYSSIFSFLRGKKKQNSEHHSLEDQGVGKFCQSKSKHYLLVLKLKDNTAK